MPPIFKNLPNYFVCKDSLSCSESAVPSSRHEHENALLEERVELFLNRDKIDSVDELVAKLPTEIKPKFFILSSRYWIKIAKYVYRTAFTSCVNYYYQHKSESNYLQKITYSVTIFHKVI